MIIYIIEWNTGYDSYHTFGYYSTKEKAELALKEINREYKDAYISDIEVE